MEYSAVDISAATNLQRLAYLYMSMTTFWTYDYACALHEEWEFLRRSRWTKVKALYIMTRHLPFFLIVMYLCLNFAPIEDPNKCRILINVYSCTYTVHALYESLSSATLPLTALSQISAICSECFFMIRTYALWNNNKIVLVGLLSTAFAMIVTSVSIRFATIATSYVTTSAIPGTPSCPSKSSSVLYFMSFIFLFVFQLVLITLTLTRAIQSWRSTKGPLQAILVKHNIFYYVCGLFLSAINILVPALFPNSPYYTTLQNFQVSILAILATRMHLHLWHLDQHMHSSDALIYISMSDMSPADCTL
ncbi:hypothetical protein EV424DRAFT_1074141 [Suillus variegatus]|nr:hypothetical protein EV424DRAFT_1074141 [Suillus variegatus]